MKSLMRLQQSSASFSHLLSFIPFHGCWSHTHSLITLLHTDLHLRFCFWGTQVESFGFQIPYAFQPITFGICMKFVHSKFRTIDLSLVFQGKTTPALIFLTPKYLLLIIYLWNPFNNAKIFHSISEYILMKMPTKGNTIKNDHSPWYAFQGQRSAYICYYICMYYIMPNDTVKINNPRGL